MPQAVLHILLPLVLMAFIKDWYEAKKGKRTFPLRYVLIAGIAGLLPDIDIVVYWFLHFFGFTLDVVHRTFTHNIFVPLLFLALFLIFRKTEAKVIFRRRLKPSLVFLMLAFGFTIHLLIDAIFMGYIMPFYPATTLKIGLDTVSRFPSPLNTMFLPSLDAILLFLWIIYMEFKHKVSDFI